MGPDVQRMLALPVRRGGRAGAARLCLGERLECCPASLSVRRGALKTILSLTSKLSQRGARAETGQKGPGHGAVMFLVNTREYLKGMNEVAPQCPRTAAPLRRWRSPLSLLFFLN